jgi:hypothetical protein
LEPERNPPDLDLASKDNPERNPVALVSKVKLERSPGEPTPAQILPA